MKFGGSSLESAQAIRRVCSIVSIQSSRQPVVVVSALGSTTNRLVELQELAANCNLREVMIREQLAQFHLGVCQSIATGRDLFLLEQDIRAMFLELNTTLEEVKRLGVTPRLSDRVLSFGERLSALIVASALRQSGLAAIAIDARELIVTDQHFTSAAPLLPETGAILRRRLPKHARAGVICVMGGFIGATEDGETTTLGRGGSDFTASIVGASISAEEIQIWTDVDGMLTCDPRVYSNPHRIRSISYREAEIMAKAGAKVLHPSTVAPAVRQRIPIVIRNSRNPQAPGTAIVATPCSEGVVMSIANASGMAVIDIQPFDGVVTPDFTDRVWGMLQRCGVEFQTVAVNNKSLSILVSQKALPQNLMQVLSEACIAELKPERAVVTCTGHLAGCNTANLTQAAQALRIALSEAVPMAADPHKLGFVVPEYSLHLCVEALHGAFFKNANPALFEVSRYREQPAGSPAGNGRSLTVVGA